MDEATVESVRTVVAAIPAGRVATYGDVAELARAPSPRLVGRVLAEDGHDLPWHRVIRADGTPAPHLAREQLARLRAEGVLAQGERIDLHTYRWKKAREKVRSADAQAGLFGDAVPGGATRPGRSSGRRSSGAG